MKICYTRLARWLHRADTGLLLVLYGVFLKGKNSSIKIEN